MLYGTSQTSALWWGEEAGQGCEVAGCPLSTAMHCFTACPHLPASLPDAEHTIVPPARCCKLLLFTFCPPHTAVPLGTKQTACPLPGTAVPHCLPHSTLYLLDVMVWKGYALYDCAAEFRAFWLQVGFLTPS